MSDTMAGERGSRKWTNALAMPALVLCALAAGGIVYWQLTADLAHRVWLVSLVLLGAPLLLRTARAVARGNFATDVVAAMAIGTAIALNEPLAGLVVVLMQTGGEALERYAEGRASQAVQALSDAAPRIAHRVSSGTEVDIPVEQIVIGDTLHVRPGDVVPVDGHVLEGASDLDTSRLTGEPLPRPVAAGSKVMSGMMNGSGAFTMRADALVGASQYARIVELVRSAESSKSPLQRLADRYAGWFTPLTLAVCVAAWLLSGDASRVLAVLVVATPCPLILATPVAFIGGINRAARRQIIVRSGSALERLAQATVAVFDKTGTITEGKPRVSHVEALHGTTSQELLRLAGAVEQRAGHLLARSVVDAARKTHAVLPAASDVREAPGRGVEGTVEGKHILVGSRGYVSERLSVPVPFSIAPDGKNDQAALRAFVAVDGEVVGTLDFEDSIRPSAAPLIQSLPSLGFSRAVLLSGDSEINARAIAAEIGIVMVEGDLLPEDKVNRVAELSQSVGRVMMVGDGTNDAPALSRADVGIALAGHGGGITAESADVVILIDDLSRVGEAITISKRTLRIAKQSIVVGLGLSSVGMVVAALGYLPPIAGALTQEAIDVAVILNALRASRSASA